MDRHCWRERKQTAGTYLDNTGADRAAPLILESIKPKDGHRFGQTMCLRARRREHRHHPCSHKPVRHMCKETQSKWRAHLLENTMPSSSPPRVSTPTLHPQDCVARVLFCPDGPQTHAIIETSARPRTKGKPKHPKPLGAGCTIPRTAPGKCCESFALPRGPGQRRL